MEIDITKVSEHLISFSILLPLIFFFVQRLIKVRDASDAEIKEDVKNIINNMKHIETQIIILTKDIKNEEFNARLKELCHESKMLQADCNRRLHWVTNTFMKIDNRLSKLDNKDLEFEEPPLTGQS